MRTIGQHQFPEPGNREDLESWTPYIRRIALSRRVLVVAKTRIEGTWKAYCDAVPGKDHDEEWQEVLRTGSQIPEEWARAFFSGFDGIPYAK